MLSLPGLRVRFCGAVATLMGGRLYTGVGRGVLVGQAGVQVGSRVDGGVIVIVDEDDVGVIVIADEGDMPRGGSARLAGAVGAMELYGAQASS
jgi:hypothetical protein